MKQKVLKANWNLKPLQITHTKLKHYVARCRVPAGFPEVSQFVPSPEALTSSICCMINDCDVCHTSVSLLQVICS